MTKQNDLEDDLGDYLKEGIRGKPDEGDASLIESFRKTLEVTTPELPGDARDYREKRKKNELQWW
jgi:hypothetical protein